jgi:hypothetical protein
MEHFNVWKILAILTVVLCIGCTTTPNNTGSSDSNAADTSKATSGAGTGTGGTETDSSGTGNATSGAGTGTGGTTK